MILDPLTAEERAAVEKMGQVRIFEAGETIIREKDAGDSLFIILSGNADVRKVLDSERSKVLKTLGPGEFFGEMSFFQKAARSADVVTISECHVLELPMVQFDKLARENPMIGCKVYKNMASELTRRLRVDNEELKKALLWAIEGWTYL